MFVTRLCLSICALVIALVFVAFLWACTLGMTTLGGEASRKSETTDSR